MITDFIMSLYQGNPVATLALALAVSGILIKGVTYLKRKQWVHEAYAQFLLLALGTLLALELGPRVLEGIVPPPYYAPYYMQTAYKVLNVLIGSMVILLSFALFVAGVSDRYFQLLACLWHRFNRKYEERLGDTGYETIDY